MTLELDDPSSRFLAWQSAARLAGDAQSELVTLVTHGLDGFPQARIMTLWGVDHRGFVVRFNSRRAKGLEIAQDPRVGLLAFWPTCRRQVRITGVAGKLPDAESDAAYASRPLSSRAIEWVVLEGDLQLVPDLDTVRRRVAEVLEQFAGDPPRPPWSSLWAVAPASVELWEQGEDRLHDRVRFTRTEQGWRAERLLP